MTEDQIKALVEKARQKELVVQYRNIAEACDDLELALKVPGIRNGVLERTINFYKPYVDAKEKEWPEIYGRFETLLQKLTDLVNAERAERAKLPWYKRIFP